MYHKRQPGLGTGDWRRVKLNQNPVLLDGTLMASFEVVWSGLEQSASSAVTPNEF